MSSLHLDIEVGKMFRIFAFFIALLCPYAVDADADNPLGISIYGSFLHTEQVPNTLFFFSDIEENDSFELRKAIRIHDIDTVVLSSRGGSVWEGLNMAGIIFDKGLKTYVPKKGLVKEGNCASACSFMFFGGSTRVADGKLGVHQFYSGSAKENAQIGKTQSNAQFTVSEIIGFLNEFETPPFVFERMFQQKEMYYFNQNELEQIGRINAPITADDVTAIDRFIADFVVVLASLEDADEPETLAPSTPIVVTPKTTEVEVEIIEPAEKETKETKTPVVEEKQLISDIQKQLNRLNCNAGKADGVIGKRTKAALKRFYGENSHIKKKVLPQSLNSGSVIVLINIIEDLNSVQNNCKVVKRDYLLCDKRYGSADKSKDLPFRHAKIYKNHMEFCTSTHCEKFVPNERKCGNYGCPPLFHYGDKYRVMDDSAHPRVGLRAISIYEEKKGITKSKRSISLFNCR